MTSDERQGWRKAERRRLLAARERVDAATLERWRHRIDAHLWRSFPGLVTAKLAFYWPTRGEYDARGFVQKLLDGLHCYCDCAERDRLRSLLSCFETRMPISCGICRESAELALRVHRDGGTLADVRAALDRKYGD